MPRLQLLFALVLAALSAPASGAVGEVYLRGTPDGLLIRVPDADLSDCELLRPTPQRVILVIRDLELPTAAPADRFELARSVRVVGPDMLGGTDSRIVIELNSSGVEAILDEVGTGVVLELRRPVLLPEPLAEAMPAVVEAPDAPRSLSTPWRRARERSQDERAAARGDAAPDDIDPADAERDRRYAEALERDRRRAEREERITAREAGREPVSPQTEPAENVGPSPSQEGPRDPAPQPEPDQGEPRAPRVSPRPDRRQAGMQPSPATPVPGGMVRVPGGAFLMGSARNEGFGDEEPQHPVDLDPFWIDSHEVTIGDFRRSPIRLPEQPSWNVDDEMPVLNVTWHEADAYCEWAGKRLPTEAEWEKAARGEDGARYPWGEGWAPEFANTGVDGDGFDRSAPTGSFPDGASPWGAEDMAGNAWEWTNDWYQPDEYQRRDRTNPSGPSRGAHKVARGGSHRGLYSVNVRSAIRLPLAPSQRRDDVGFRCASEPR